jgi:hypothetical protein
MKSGDQFIYSDDEGKFKPRIFTLQKLPDFELWMLIDQNNKMFLPPMENPKDAFGLWYGSFKTLIKHD